jgi:hypothetical protein
VSDNYPLLTVGRVAGGALQPRRIVKHGAADNVVLMAALYSDALCGITGQLATEQGKTADVQSYGIAPVEYGAEVTRGQPLTSDALGRAIPATLGHRIIGFATESGVLGTIGACLIAPATLAVGAMQLAITEAMLTDGDGAQSFPFAEDLPANAVILGYEVRVSAAFTDGAAGVFTLDVGVQAGDTDALIDGAALGTIQNIANAPGIRPTGRYGAVRLLATVLGTVNVANATAGAAVIEVYYAVL